METDREVELQSEMVRIRKELDSIAGERAKKENKALLGKHFIYPKNCYSCPSKPSDYWPLYLKVVALGDGGRSLLVFEFQTDKDGQITITPKRYAAPMLSGFVPCSPAKFNRALAALKRKVASL